MKPLDQIPSRALVSILFVLLQACSTLVPVPTTSPSPVPEETRVPLSQLVTLSSISFREEGQSPAYSITAQTPKFSGSEDERVQTFNQAVSGLVQAEIDYFRKNLLAQMPSVPVSAGSFFQAQYSVIFQNGNLWSLKFDFSGYADGAAHPYHYSLTYSYDLERGKKLSLGELLRKDSEYLEVISRICIAELSRRDIGFYGGFQQGAEPTADNYRNWNMTPEGLVFTFDEYQVAPYAAGPQTVVVPYGELTSLVNPEGPLAGIVR